MKLSICVVTMNRAVQLKEALESCLACELPKETEFVIVDNASTDETEQVVNETLGRCGYSYCYEKLTENLGVGGGRNYAYKMACGDYVYMLDDDAVINHENEPDFFLHAVKILEEYQDIVTLTTQIYDVVWKKNRVEPDGPKIASALYKCQMLCGGSHFLRRSFYQEPPYLSNKYGYEEIPPSLRAMNEDKINAFCPDLLVIHKPAVNKWNYDDEKNQVLLVKEIALQCAIKKMMYPALSLPLLKLATRRRIKKYMTKVPNASRRVRETEKAFCAEYPIKEKIKFSTLCRMFKDFKLSVF